jgi:hypothetical protein
VKCGRRYLAKRKNILKQLKVLNLVFKKKLAINKEQWNCATKMCKVFLKANKNDKLIFDESKLNYNNQIPLSKQVPT